MFTRRLPTAFLIISLSFIAYANNGTPPPRSPESCRIAYWSKKDGDSEEHLAGHCSATLVAPDSFVTAAHCALDSDEIAKHHIVSTTVSCPNSEFSEDSQERKVIVELKQKPDITARGIDQGHDVSQDLMVIRSERKFKATPARLATDSNEEQSLLEATPRHCFRAGFTSSDPKNLAGTFTIDENFTSQLDPFVGFSIGHTLIESSPKRYPGDSGGGMICIDSKEKHVLIGVLHGTENIYGDSVNSERPSFSPDWFKYALSDDKPADNTVFDARMLVSDYCSRAEGCLNSVGTQVAKLNTQMATLLHKLNSEFHQTLNESLADRSLDGYQKKSQAFWDIFADCYHNIRDKIKP